MNIKMSVSPEEPYLDSRSAYILSSTSASEEVAQPINNVVATSAQKHKPKRAQLDETDVYIRHSVKNYGKRVYDNRHLFFYVLFWLLFLQ